MQRQAPHGLRGVVTHAGQHAWAPDVAPTYRCLRETPEGEPCPAVGYRRLRSVRDAAIVEAEATVHYSGKEGS